jgi:DNA-binding response OmpR family regulator
MRLLVAEDDPMLSAGLVRVLERAGYVVDLARNGEDVVAASVARTYTLILLDIGLMGMDGMAALRAIRARRDTTLVIVLTANDRPEQKVLGLDAGADDYVVKPFDLDELLARIRAQIRSRERRPSDSLVAGDVMLDLAGRSVTLAGKPVSLTAKEFRVLSTLMRRSSAFVSKGELEAALYDDSATVESNTIEVAVYGLRRKLGNDVILTARGLGYTVPNRP